MTGIRLHNDPSMYGRIPDAPEMECDGVFDENKCIFCSEHDSCKVESEIYETDNNNSIL